MALLWTLPALVLTAGNGASPAPARGEAAFNQAVHLFNDFDDDGASKAFQALLRSGPSARLAARAHLYLGLIAFNSQQPEAARAEFQQALRIDPSLDLVSEGSPKARMLFGETRNEVMREIEAEGARPPAPPAATAPAPVPAAALEAPAAPGHHSHVLSLALAGVTAAAAAFAIVGAVEVANYNSTMTQIGNDKLTGQTSSQVAGEQSSAQAWQAAGIACGIAAALSVAGAVITW